MTRDKAHVTKMSPRWGDPMNDRMKCMFDTNVFDKVLDGKISVESIAESVDVYATHIQSDEIDRMPKPERKNHLQQVFAKFFSGDPRSDDGRVVATESAVWDVSRWDSAKFGDGDLYGNILNELNNIKKKPNNIQDALIAETAIKNGFVLVTEDTNLRRVSRKHGATCLTFEDLLRSC